MIRIKSETLWSSQDDFDHNCGQPSVPKSGCRVVVVGCRLGYNLMQ
ncbi:MAG: hypothetical protein N3A57_07835 [Negativicutes bacterium]|nr:hypothetical protein [Negativicutes bacterium]